MAYKHAFNRDQNYLAHFNPNHDPKNGRFTTGPQMSLAEREKANKQIYKEARKISIFKPNNYREKHLNDPALIDASKDKKLRKSRQEYIDTYKKSVPMNPDIDPERYNKYVDNDVKLDADIMFEVDRGHPYDSESPMKYNRVWDERNKKWSVTDEELFNFYLDRAMRNNEKYKEDFKKYYDAIKSDEVVSANNKYNAEVERVAREFTGKYADKKTNGGTYIEYSEYIKYILEDILDREDT